MSAAAQVMLSNYYDFQGNIRALRNSIERAVLFCQTRPSRGEHVLSGVHSGSPPPRRHLFSASRPSLQTLDPLRLWHLTCATSTARGISAISHPSGGTNSTRDFQREISPWLPHPCSSALRLDRSEHLGISGGGTDSPSLLRPGPGRRYRSLGCVPCTSPLPSYAATIPQMIAGLRLTTVVERSGRAQDEGGGMETLCKLGHWSSFTHFHIDLLLSLSITPHSERHLI